MSLKKTTGMVSASVSQEHVARHRGVIVTPMAVMIR
jgi:hypothetical protein